MCRKKTGSSRNLIKADASGKASNKGEKTEESDEQKLEAVGVESEGEFVGNDVVTDGGGVDVRLGGSGQESGDGRTLLALKGSKAVFVYKFLGLGKTSLGSFLVVEVGNRGSVDGGVDENGVDLLVTATVEASNTEVLGSLGERGVSLALRRRSLTQKKQAKNS